MIYKLAHLEDVRMLPISEWSAVPIVKATLSVLDEVYGEDRNVDESDGGYLLYASRGTNPEELKAYWNYEDRLCESIEVEDGYATILYLLNNEYSVTLVMAVEDLPEDLKQGLED